MSFTRRLLVSWLVDAASLLLVAWIFQGVSVGGSVVTLLFAAAVYGVLSMLVKPLLKLVTLPLALLTLGIAWYGVAMVILWLTSVVVGGFDIDGFFTLVGATFVVWAAGGVIDRILFPRGWRRRNR